MHYPVDLLSLTSHQSYTYVNIVGECSKALSVAWLIVSYLGVVGHLNPKSISSMILNCSEDKILTECNPSL